MILAWALTAVVFLLAVSLGYVNAKRRKARTARGVMSLWDAGHVLMISRRRVRQLVAQGELDAVDDNTSGAAVTEASVTRASQYDLGVSRWRRFARAVGDTLRWLP